MMADSLDNYLIWTMADLMVSPLAAEKVFLKDCYWDAKSDLMKDSEKVAGWDNLWESGSDSLLVVAMAT